MSANPECAALNSYLVDQTISPYNSAVGGLPGKGIGGYQVPAPGDEAHQYIAPTDQDIRGPCPGLNALANRE